MSNRLLPGGAGKINVASYGRGFRARRHVRLLSGEKREVTGYGPTGELAITNAEEKTCLLLGGSQGSETLLPTSLVKEAAALMFDEMKADLKRPKPRRCSATVTGYINEYRWYANDPLGSVRLCDLTPKLCSDVITAISDIHLVTGIATNGQVRSDIDHAKRAYRVLKMILNFAIKMDAMTINPLDKIERPLVPAKETKALSDLDVARLRAAAWEQDLAKLKPNSNGKRHRGPKPTFYVPVLFDLMLGTGARRGEAQALTWGDIIQIDGKWAVYFRKTLSDSFNAEGKYRQGIQPWLKGGNVDNPKYRIVFLPPFVIAALEYIRPHNVSDDQYIFAAQSRQQIEPTPITMANMSNKMQSYVKQAKMDETNFVPHLLRKTLATVIAYSSDDFEKWELAGRVLGHSQPQQQTITGTTYIQYNPKTPDVTSIIQDFVEQSEKLIPLPPR